MADQLGKPVGIVGHLDALGHPGLGLLCFVQDEALALDERPLDPTFSAEHVEALAILPRSVEKRKDR